jgi:hypothetical protein
MKCICVFTFQHQQEQGSPGKEKTTTLKEIIPKKKEVLQ